MGFRRCCCGVNLPSCNCANVPRNLQMETIHGDTVGNWFTTGDVIPISYQTVPASLVPAIAAGSAFLSNSTYTDPFGYTFYWYIRCNVGTWVAIPSYPGASSGFPTGPTNGPIRYTWSIGASGNSCSPFLMRYGVVYTGGDPATDVELYGV